MELNSKQRSYLRSCAQTLDPVVMVGKDGMKEGVFNALNEALHCHELVKVRFVAHKDEVKELAYTLEEKTFSTLVAITGFTALYFRQDKRDKAERIYHI